MADIEQLRPQRARVARKPASSRPEQRPVPDPEGPSTRRRSHKQRKQEGYTVVSFFRDYRTHLGFGIFLCLAAIVMTVCAVSFISNNAVDQSVIHGRTAEEIVRSGDTVDNAGGVLGAKLGELMMVHTFGISSFILAFYIFVLGLAVMRVRRIHFFSLTFRCLFSTAAVSIIVGLLSFNRATHFNLGGTHGYYMNKLILDYSDALGAYAVMVLLVGLLVAVFLNPLKTFFGMLGRVMKRKSAVEENVEQTSDEDAADSTLALDELEAKEDDEENSELVAAFANAAAEADAQVAAGEPDHSRFMPPVGLDAFDDKSDAAESVDNAYSRESVPAEAASEDRKSVV